MQISQALLTSILILGWNDVEALDTKLMKLCVSQTTCSSCLEINSSCAWCSDLSYSNSTVRKPRCNLPESLKAFHCDPAEIITTSRKRMKKLLKNADFQDVTKPDQAPIQLRPQKVKVRLAPRTKTEINLSYRPAKNSYLLKLKEMCLYESRLFKMTKTKDPQSINDPSYLSFYEPDRSSRNYPLDLYYLMDLTLSMQNDKQTLVNLGVNMTNTLRMFTKNYRLAFGSYADRHLMPIKFPGYEDNPCKSYGEKCDPLYTFHHRLSLTNDFQRFIHEVNESIVTANLDDLKAGMDGVVQVAVCAERVGWAHEARKIILMVTNGYLHFAGDGKLTGTMQRSDFKCHLDKDGKYNMATTFDYPSLAEVSRVLKENKVNLILAATKKRRWDYELIADLLEEKARFAILDNDSSNIIQIIKSSYLDLISRVVLRDNAMSPLRVQYFSNCGKEHEIETAECGDIEEGKVYNFKVVLSFDQCPRNESLLKQRVVIEDALASKASELVIDVELLCDCMCKDSDNSHCVHGFNECGVCKCDFGWSGEYCNCDQSSAVDYRQQCMADNDTKICSNRGDCICGSCSCDEGFLGTYCECVPCKMFEGIECGGTGNCVCGVCECSSLWTGEACECPTALELCMAPGTEDVCSGHGDCECGKCQCKTENYIVYHGKYCELPQSSASNKLCTLYNGCVNATIEDPQRSDYSCRTNVSNYNTMLVDNVDENHESYCCVENNNGALRCIIPYIYEFQKGNHVLLKIGIKKCNNVNSAAVMLSIYIVVPVVAILAIIACWRTISSNPIKQTKRECIRHILTIIELYRTYVTNKDNKEVAKFELEVKEETIFSPEENPLYISPVSEYKNPLYYKED